MSTVCHGVRVARSRLISIAFVLAAAAPAFAQGEQSGEVEQSLRRRDEERRLERQQPRIEIKRDGDELRTTSPAARFFVKSIAITGNVSIPTAELRPFVAELEGKEVTLADLRAAADRITAYYRSRGYGISWAYLPAQVIKEGVVEISIIEARVDKVLVRGNAHYDTNFILDHMVGVQEGEALDLDTLERGLLNLNDYPGLSVAAKLTPGGTQGTSDLYLEVQDKFPVNMSVDYDNFGSEFVAEHRVGVTAEAFNLAELGHWISVRGVEGFGEGELHYVTGSYTAPFANGLRFHLYASRYDYEAEGDVVVFEPIGDGIVAGANVGYSIWRNSEYTLALELGYEHKDLKQELLDIEISDDRLRIVVSTLRFEWNDDFDGRWLGSLQYRQGLEDFAGGLESDDPDASRVGAGGDFAKVVATVYRLQRVTPWMHLIGRLTYQFSADPLVVSEQISIGGPDSVRGYPPFEFMGDRGYTASIEARFKLPFLSEIPMPFDQRQTLADMVQIGVFADTGWGELENPTFGEVEDLRLSGAGFGLRIQYPRRLAFRFDVGWPLTDEEPSTGDEPTLYVSLIVNLL